MEMHSLPILFSGSCVKDMLQPKRNFPPEGVNPIWSRSLVPISPRTDLERDWLWQLRGLGNSRTCSMAATGALLGEDPGGYDCEFIQPPSSAFQTECPICLHILKQPCLISCPCGQKICRECVEKIKEDNKPCPLCNKTNFTFMRDYGLERSLKEFLVLCSFKNDGCEWKGKLGEYRQHLNWNPSPQNRLSGCKLVSVKCEHGCGEWLQRRHITAHVKEQCMKRPYSCSYCQEYKSTYEE